MKTLSASILGFVSTFLSPTSVPAAEQKGLNNHFYASWMGKPIYRDKR